MRVTCPRCGYTWEYRGRRMRVSCPSCGYTFRLHRGSAQASTSRAAVTSGSSEVSVTVLSGYDCFLRVLREHGVRVVEGEGGADSVAIPEQLAEELWRDLIEKCAVRAR